MLSGCVDNIGSRQRLCDNIYEEVHKYGKGAVCLLDQEKW